MEGWALITLGLPMLYCDASQVLIHHGSINGSGPLLIHGGRLAQPEVNVIGKSAAGLLCLIEDSTHATVSTLFDILYWISFLRLYVVHYFTDILQ